MRARAEAERLCRTYPGVARREAPIATHAHHAPGNRSQRFYAGLAGALYLWLIVNGVVGTLILSHVSGSGSFADTATRIAASERLYRVGLSSRVLETLSGVLLFFALYATLKPVDNLLAQLALIWSLLDSSLGCVVRSAEFVRLHLYTSPLSGGAGTGTAEVLADLTRTVAGTIENIGGICFGIGSLLFFFLFFKSHYIPRILSVLGLAASGTWVILYFGSLIFPERHDVFQYICFPPMALAILATGVCLLVFAARGRSDTSPENRPGSES